MRPAKDEIRDRLRAAATAVGGTAHGALGRLWWAFLVRGGLAVLLGLVALFWPQKSLGLLVGLVGLYLAADGVVGIVGAVRAEERGVHLGQAVLALVLGVVLLVWPGATARTLLAGLGLAALCMGASQVVSAWRGDVEGADREALRNVGLALGGAGLVLLLWPAIGVVAIAWVIALAALVVGGMLLNLAARFKRLRERLEALAKRGPA